MAAAAVEEFQPQLRRWLRDGRQLKQLAFALCRDMRENRVPFAQEVRGRRLKHSLVVGPYRFVVVTTLLEGENGGRPVLMLFERNTQQDVWPVVLGGMLFDLPSVLRQYSYIRWEEDETSNMFTLYQRMAQMPALTVVRVLPVSTTKKFYYGEAMCSNADGMVSISRPAESDVLFGEDEEGEVIWKEDTFELEYQRNTIIAVGIDGESFLTEKATKANERFHALCEQFPEGFCTE